MRGMFLNLSLHRPFSLSHEINSTHCWDMCCHIWDERGSKTGEEITGPRDYGTTERPQNKRRLLATRPPIRLCADSETTGRRDFILIFLNLIRLPLTLSAPGGERDGARGG